MRTTREGPQTGTHKAAVPRGHKEETDSGQGGGRYRKWAAAEAAAVTYSGGGSAGGRYRNRAAQQAAVTGSGRPSQAAVTRHEKRAAVTGGRYRNNALRKDDPTAPRKIA
jgi:hypothetical protein